MTEPKVSIYSSTGEYAARLEKVYEKIKSGEANVEKSLEYILETLLEDLSPKLMKIDEVKEAFIALMGLLSEMSGEKILVEIKGLEGEPKTFKCEISGYFPSSLGFLVSVLPSSLLKYIIRIYPKPIELTPVNPTDIEDYPRIEINIEIIPKILEENLADQFLEGKTITFLDTINEKITFQNIPTIYEWTEELDGKLSKSDYTALKSMLEKENTKQILKHLPPTLNTIFEKFNV